MKISFDIVAPLAIGRSYLHSPEIFRDPIIGRTGTICALFVRHLDADGAPFGGYRSFDADAESGEA